MIFCYNIPSSLRQRQIKMKAQKDSIYGMLWNIAKGEIYGYKHLH